MENIITRVLNQTIGVEIAPADSRERIYIGSIKLVMNSEIDFLLTQTGDSKKYDANKIPFKEGKLVYVLLKTRDGCYSYEQECTYVKKTIRYATLSVKYPVSLTREQKRAFVRTPINAKIVIFSIANNKEQEKNSIVLNGVCINTRKVRGIDIGGGGIAFFDSVYSESGSSVLIDFSFVSPDLSDYKQSAQILRCVKISQKEEKYFIGARFIDPPFLVQQKLNKFVFAKIRERAKMKKKVDG